MEHDIVQLKFTSGNEVVCQVLEWPEPNDNQMIVRNALAIVNVETEDNERMYMFIPWLHFAEGEKDYLTVNTDHIMATGKPTPYLRDQYKIAVVETNHASKQRELEHKKRKTEGLEKLERAINRVMRTSNESDDQPVEDNIVRFPGPSNDDIIH